MLPGTVAWYTLYAPPPPLPPTHTPQVARNRISGIVGLDALTDLDALDVAGNVIADPQALGGLAACTRLGRIAASDNAMHRCPRYRFAMWVACDCGRGDLLAFHCKVHPECLYSPGSSSYLWLRLSVWLSCDRLECVPSLVIFDGELVPKQEAGLAVRSCAMRVAE